MIIESAGTGPVAFRMSWQASDKASVEPTFGALGTCSTRSNAVHCELPFGSCSSHTQCAWLVGPSLHARSPIGPPDGVVNTAVTGLISPSIATNDVTSWLATPVRNARGV